MTRYAHSIHIAVAAVGLLALASACGGSDSKKDQTSTPAPGVTASSALKTTAAASGTVAALRTAAAGITVLPGGTAVTAGGTAVPAALATEVASLPAPGQTPAGNGGTPAAGSTTSARPTEIPLCVADPTVPNCATPPPAPTPADAAAQGIAMDANPSTPGVETSDIAVASGQNFTVGLNIVTAPAPYQGYSWDIIMEGPIAYVSEAPSNPAGLTTCGPTNPVVGGEIYGGCLTTREPVTYTGSIGTVTFRCTGAGAGSLRLRRPSDPGNAGFDTALILPGGAPLTDAVGPPIKVVCS